MKVLSGDSIVLVSKPRPDGKPPNERILSLAYVSAPRMKREGDEVCAIRSFQAEASLSHLLPENIFVNFSWAKTFNFRSSTRFPQ
jgi:hypothetical protein